MTMAMAITKPVFLWSNLLTYVSSLLISTGLLLHHLVQHQPDHQLYYFSLMMSSVGFTGLFAALSRAELLIKAAMLLLTFLIGVTLRLVLDRCMDDVSPCPVAVTSVHASQRILYMETMPGLYVEVGNQVSYVVETVVTESTNCTTATEKVIQRMWGHMVFLLFTTLVSALLCCWRLLVALAMQEDTEEPCDADEDESLYDVFASAKDVPMPPPGAFEAWKASNDSAPLTMATLPLPQYPEHQSTFPAPRTTEPAL